MLKGTVYDKLANINVKKTLVKILKDKRIQKQITDLNTEVQLFQRGEDSEGKKLEKYAPSTIRIKKIRRQPTNRTTLKDTGDMYETWYVNVGNDASFTIEANTVKDGYDLREKYGDDIVGLTDENVKIVIELLEQEFYKELLSL